MTSQRDESGQPAPPSSGGKSGNFRSSYYEKVGFKGVDERKALQAILASNPVNIEKLKLFVLKSSSLHETNRLLVWKILLGVLSSSKGDQEYWWEWKIRCYNDCLRAVQALTCDIDATACLGRPEILTVLWRSLEGPPRLSGQPLSQQLSEPDSKRFLSVSKYILTICDSECEAEAFYISKALCEKLNVSEAVINEHVAFYTKTLALQKELNNACDRIGLNEALPLRKWISRGMTGMFRSQHLTKVLDKVVAGSPRVLVFLALALVEHNRLKIRESENAYEAVGKMTAAAATASEDTESRIISIALERWSRDQQKASSTTSTQIPEIGDSKKLFSAMRFPAGNIEENFTGTTRSNFPISPTIMVLQE